LGRSRTLRSIWTSWKLRADDEIVDRAVHVASAGHPSRVV
jgi:hypothetical protein